MTLEQSFGEVYALFKLNFYRSIFEQVHEREGSLTAMEAFSIEVIYALGEPTIGQFAQFCGISQPNATYKVAALVKKGYLEKLPSDQDKREYHLRATDKFRAYYGVNHAYIRTVMGRIRERFTPEQTAAFGEMLQVIARELMPECQPNRSEDDA